MMSKRATSLLPHLRFPEFREAGPWEEKRLGDDDVCEINPTSSGLPDKFIYIDLESVVSGELIQEKEISKDDAPSRAQRQLQDGDVIYQTVRPYQRNNYFCKFETEKVYVASTGYAQLRPCNSGEFLFQSIHTNSFVNSVLEKCTGSNYPAIRATDLAQVNVLVPKAPEQQKIASCLASLDDLISTRGQKLAALERHKKGLMQQLFPATGQTTPHLRFPEFLDAGPWDEKRLGDVVDVFPGFGFPEKYQGKKDGKYPFYKVSDISNAIATGTHFIEKSANYVDDDDLIDLKARTVASGTTIFAKIGEAIRSNRRTITTKECVIDNNTAGIKAKNGKANDMFAFYLFSRVNLIDHSGGVVPSVNKTTMENIGITCPQLTEQQKIATCLASVDDLIRAEAQKLDALMAHKKGLMQQLFPNADEGAA